MAVITLKNLRRVHRCTCVLAALGFATWAIYLYWLDKDLTQINVKKFNAKEEDVYPSISLFFYSPIPNTDNLKKYGHGITPLMYKRFLQGEEWNETLMSVDYNDVTIQLMDHFLEFYAEYVDNENFLYTKDDIKVDNGWTLPYSNGNTSVGKAFTIDIPFQPHKRLRALTIKLKSDVFPNHIRPKQISPFNGGDGFGIYFHYPKQLWRNKHFRKISWPLRTENSSKSYYMEFEIQNLEVMQNRNKMSSPCINGIEDLDDLYFENLAKRLPCRPPYFNPSRLLPSLFYLLPGLRENTFPCTSQQEMKQCHDIIIHQPSMENMKIPPCRSLEKVDFNYFELNIPDRHPPSIIITVVFIDETYIEISKVRALDISALVGNIGGYIGIFVGYSLIMTPDVVMMLFTTLRKRKNRRVTVKTSIIKRQYLSKDNIVSV